GNGGDPRLPVPAIASRRNGTAPHALRSSPSATDGAQSQPAFALLWLLPPCRIDRRGKLQPQSETRPTAPGPAGAARPAATRLDKLASLHGPRARCAAHPRDHTRRIGPCSRSEPPPVRSNPPLRRTEHHGVRE